MNMKRFLSALLALLLAVSAIMPMTVVAEDAVAVYNGAAITDHKGGYDYYDRTLVTYTYDFSLERLSHYASDPNVVMSNITAKIDDGVLTTEKGKDFVFGSAICLGDQYGLEEGYLSFDLKLTGGIFTVGVRTSRTGAVSDDRGIWFRFDGSNTLSMTEPECGLEASVPMPISTAEAKTFTIHDGLDTLTLSCGDTVIAIVRYTEEGYLAFCGADGTVVAETDKCELYQTGYFSMNLCDIDGYLDNVVFTHVEEKWVIPETDELRIIDYSTWTATDDLGRTVADNATAGDPKENRYVGLFYFLCWVGAGVHVQDNTKLYLELGAEEAIKYIDQYGGEETDLL